MALNPNIQPAQAQPIPNQSEPAEMTHARLLTLAEAAVAQLHRRFDSDNTFS
jgi:hypothetical protein